MDMRGFDWDAFGDGTLAYGIVGDIFDGSEPDIFTELAGARGYVFTEERSRDEWPEGSMGTWLVKEPDSMNVIMEPESYCKANDIEVFISFTNLKSMLSEAQRDNVTMGLEVDAAEEKARQRLEAIRNLASHVFGMKWDEQESALELALRIAEEVEPRTMPKGMIWPTFKPLHEQDMEDGAFPYSPQRKVTFFDFYETDTKDASGKQASLSVGKVTFDSEGFIEVEANPPYMMVEGSQVVINSVMSEPKQLDHARYVYDHDMISIDVDKPVYLIRDGNEYDVANLYAEYGQIRLVEHDDGSPTTTERFSFMTSPANVTVAKPVFDRNDVMILKGDFVWSEDGCMAYRVEKVGYTLTLIPVIGEKRPIKKFANTVSLAQPDDTQAILNWCLTLTDEEYVAIYTERFEDFWNGEDYCEFVKNDINRRQRDLDAKLCICEDGSCPVKNPDLSDDDTNTPEDEDTTLDGDSDGSDEMHWAPSIPVSHDDDMEVPE